jgi:hypothetical protein
MLGVSEFSLIFRSLLIVETLYAFVDPQEKYSKVLKL